MHTLFLGTCHDLHASTLGYWVRNNLLGLNGSLSQQLQEISLMLKHDCVQAGCLCFHWCLGYGAALKNGYQGCMFVFPPILRHTHTHTHPLGSLGSVSTSKLSPLRTQDWTRAANSQSWGRHSKQHLSKVHAGGLPRKQSKLQTVVLMKLSLFAQGQKSCLNCHRVVQCSGWALVWPHALLPGNFNLVAYLDKDGFCSLIAMTHWHLHSAIYTMDHAGLLFEEEEAQDSPVININSKRQPLYTSI